MKIETELKSFVGSQFIGKPVLADIEFLSALKKINKLAKKHQVKIHVTSSARQQGLSVAGAIVKPASRSNHLVGHAIDMNIQSSDGFFDSKALKKSKLDDLPANVKAFIQAIRSDSNLRWGGDFNNQDPVHIDDALNIKDAALWDQKFSVIQSELIALTRPHAEANQPRLLFLTRPIMQGADVLAVQHKLIEKGIDMHADSFFGVITDTAVTAFQEQSGLEPDGIVGPGVRSALGL